MLQELVDSGNKFRGFNPAFLGTFIDAFSDFNS